MSQECKKVYCPEFALSDGATYDKMVDLLFDESDGVNLFAERSDLADGPYFADLSPVINLIIKSEQINESLLKITFEANGELREYFKNIKSLCANLKDCSLSYAPFIYFKNTRFVRCSDVIADFNLKTNKIEVTPQIAQKAARTYAQNIICDPEYLQIKDNFRRLPDGKKRYYLNTGIALIKNLLLYYEREKAARSKEENTAKLFLLNKILSEKERINAAAYKRLVCELFGGVLPPDINYAENFYDLCRMQTKIDRLMHKLEFYLTQELDVMPNEKIFIS